MNDEIAHVAHRRIPARRQAEEPPLNLHQVLDALGTSFSFHNACGSPVTMTSSQVINPRPAPLDSIYEDDP